jgi:hypothetical protein
MKPTSCAFNNIFKSFDNMFEETNHLFEEVFEATLSKHPTDSTCGELTYKLTLNGRNICIVSTPDSLTIEVDGEGWAKERKYKEIVDKVEPTVL